MAEEVQELLVSIRSEGTKEVTEDLKKQRDTFEDTADSVGEQTGRLEKFSKRWRGAATIFAGGFGTLVAAVASKMPILQESAGLFGLVLDTAGMKMSRFTRDDLSPMNERLLETVKRINEADSALEVLAVTVAGLVTAPFQPGIALVEKFTRKLLGLGESETVLHDRLIPAFEDLAETVRSTLTGAFDTFKSAVSGIGSWLTTQFGNARRAVIETFVQPLIERINDLIRRANQLPGVDVGLVGGVASGREGRRQFRASDPAISHGPRVPGAASGLAADPSGRVTVMGTIEQETNLDGQTIGRSSKPFTVKGVLRGGRGARLR